MDNYKTAAELGITDLEYQALLRTIEVLEDENRVLGFRMSVQCAVKGDESEDAPIKSDPVSLCDTNCCIGGTMGLLMLNNMRLPDRVTQEMSKRIDEFMMERGALSDGLDPPFRQLFYDNLFSGTRPDEGIEAIREFLSGNIRNPWKGNVGEDP